MIVFDLFTDAVSNTPGSSVHFTNRVTQSPRVKNGYIDDLRSSRMVEGYLLPTIFNFLNIGAGGKPFPLDMWAVDEFVVSCGSRLPL